MKIPITSIDFSWTLFLDRDGVINVNKPDSYVFTTDEFIFTEGALEAIAYLSKLFGRIIVVTNQRGVGKGLMTEETLQDIHHYMISVIEKAGGRIDDIFYCTSLDDHHPDRKPNPGMPARAKAKYPEIDFSKSIVVGDKAMDMQLGRNIGAMTVWITSPAELKPEEEALADMVMDSLSAFSKMMETY